MLLPKGLDGAHTVHYCTGKGWAEILMGCAAEQGTKKNFIINKELQLLISNEDRLKNQV